MGVRVRVAAAWGASVSARVSATICANLEPIEMFIALAYLVRVRVRVGAGVGAGAGARARARARPKARARARAAESSCGT